MSTIYAPQSQRNPSWASHPLGVGVPGATIGAFGCFITAAAMILTHYLGKLITPYMVDQGMDALGLYLPTPGGGKDLWPDSALRSLFNRFGGVGSIVVTRWDYRGVSADLSKLAMDDTQERLVILDFDHNPNDGIQTHAVRAFSWVNGVLTIDDPWYGSRDDFRKNYGPNLAVTIQAIVGYQLPGFVPFWKRPTTPPPILPPTGGDPCADLRSSLSQAQAQVATLSKQNMDLAAKVTNAQNALK